MTDETPVLVGDIGGTNARFALARKGADGQPVLAEVHKYKSADFPSFPEALRHYLDEATGDAGVRRAVFAVATAVLGDTVRLTNSPWVVSAPEARRLFGLEALRLVNDFQAIGRAVPLMGPQDLTPIGPLPAPGWRADMTLAVVGPGTGLGVCMVRLRRGVPMVLPSEAGHMAFAPADAREAEVLRLLQQRYGRVSNERLLSGPGLVALHEALCEIEGRPSSPARPEAITDAAARAPDGPEARTVQLFCDLYGAVAGDFALAFGAWDGLFLAGNLTSVLLPALQASRFRQRFEDKGRFADAMARVPSLAMTRRLIGLTGTAALALEED